jgi:hypothetical protein
LQKLRSAEEWCVLALLELQQSFARAMTTGDGTKLAGYLIGGSHPDARLGIHLRHYAASLATALCDKFPASAWLLGGAAMREAAAAYVRLHPPMQPCIAEYGQDFPRFLRRHASAAQLPYVESFVQLEHALGQASIAIEESPLTWRGLTQLGAEGIVDSTLALQPGIRYVGAAWRIDELMQTYVAGEAPERFVLTDATTLIEVRGGRGSFRLTRLDEPTFAFRTALAKGRTIGEAADSALAVDPTFDAGTGLHALVDERLVTGCSTGDEEAFLR